MKGSFELPNTSPFRIKIALDGSGSQKFSVQDLGNKLVTEKTNEISNIKESSPANNAGATKNIEQPIQQSNGWGATRGPIHNYANSISERSAIQSRVNAERQQRLNAISGNVAQLIGRLNQESISVGCSLWVNEGANKGYLKCMPENYTEQIKFYLAPANIEWVKQSDLQQPAMCIPIQIRDAHAAC